MQSRQAVSPSHHLISSLIICLFTDSYISVLIRSIQKFSRTVNVRWMVAQNCLAAWSKSSQLRGARRSAGGGILWRASSATNRRVFSAGSLGNRIGSTGQAQEIPDDQEHNADELRKRRREMEQAAP